MTILESLIAGLVQGITEFLPVSSSGHLVLVHSFFGMEEPEVFFDICLHFATLGAVLVFFRKDIAALFTRAGSRLVPYLLIATIPAGIGGFFLRDFVTGFFMSPKAVSFMLIVTALVLVAGQVALVRMPDTKKGPGFFSSVTVGVFQVFALIPGISRSGITVSAGLVSGVSAENSFRFSFLMSIPVIAGAMLYEIVSGGGGKLDTGDLLVYSAGMVTAFISGLLGLGFLLTTLRSVVGTTGIIVFK